ncbi:hypothetical protein HPB52_004663 [Rhipicephalus sanguineus]|uniref:SWIM-type domain-containing protein n=1 Tax=Rhipicephalus sanguineus TaxID=34632 RepID=A0A9D4QFE1_RHISA|nr:hypothetical protein HPB52_004663 [Rhipicephalus sanguineus]
MSTGLRLGICKEQASSRRQLLETRPEVPHIPDQTVPAVEIFEEGLFQRLFLSTSFLAPDLSPFFCSADAEAARNLSARGSVPTEWIDDLGAARLAGSRRVNIDKCGQPSELASLSELLRLISGATCSCKAGSDGACKHVAAVALELNNLADATSSTDVPQASSSPQRTEGSIPEGLCPQLQISCKDFTDRTQGHVKCSCSSAPYSGTS